MTDIGFFLQMPIEVFRQAFGSEWFIEHDASPPMRVGWLFDEPATVLAPRRRDGRRPVGTWQGPPMAADRRPD